MHDDVVDRDGGQPVPERHPRPAAVDRDVPAALAAPAALVALVNAALMGGENVTERILTRIFRSAIDFVVHLRRDQQAEGTSGIRRRVIEIVALTPGRRDEGFSTEALFRRESLEEPLLWTGALPPTETGARIEWSLPDGVTVESILSGKWQPAS